MLIPEAVKKLVFTKIGTSNINNLRYVNRPFLGLFHSFPVKISLSANSPTDA